MLLEHQDQHQSVSYDVPASDLLISKSEVQTVYTDEPKPDNLSQDNPEICSAPLMQVLESQCQQSVNFYSAISNSKDYFAMSAQVSEVQRNQSIISSVTLVVCKTKTR